MIGNLNKIKEKIVAGVTYEEGVVRGFFSHLSAATKRVATYVLAVYVLIATGAMVFGAKTWQEYVKTSSAFSDTQKKEAEDQKLGQYIMFIMGMRDTKMSEFQRQLMAQTIVRVSGNVFDSYEERTWFVVLINNESGFDRIAKSPAGAVGLTQVMPQFIEEFGGHCGLKDINVTEVFDTEVNLTLGACRFKHLLVNYNGVYSTALAAYNGGKNAKSVKDLQKLAKLTTEETLQYIVRFTHVKATADANTKNSQETNGYVSNIKYQLNQ